MVAYLQRLADLGVLVFVVSTMLAMGLSQRLADIVAPLKKPVPVMLALLVNFVLSPLLALALSRLVPLQPPHAIGLLLLGAAAGAPFIPKLAEIAGGNLAYSLALTVLLMGGSIVFMPLALPLMVPGLKADPWAIAKPLLFLMVIPLAIGLALAPSGASWTKTLLAVVRMASNLAAALVIVLMIGLNFKTLLGTLGSFAIATYALYMLALVGAAYLLGLVDKPTRAVFALGAGSRNLPAALLLASASFDDTAITVMVVVGFVVTLIMLPPLARAMRPPAMA